MRIINQLGTADIPYNSVMVFVNTDAPSQIYASSVHDTFNDLPLGTYNNEEDAMYVMKNLRRAMKYGFDDYYYMPSADFVPVMRQKEKEGESNGQH